MQYPIKLNFKKIALARQAHLSDASGESIAYARQKLLKLKEELEVFRDKSRNEKLCTIKADRVIDFRAAYQFVSEAEQVFGSIKREGLRSSGRPPTTFKRPMVHPLPPFARRSLWPRSLMRSLVTFLWWGFSAITSSTHPTC